MPRALVALDLDGTLLTEDSQLPARHLAAVEQLRDDGHVVVICTGRPLITAVGIWRRLSLATPMICFNGGWVGMPGGATLVAKELEAGLAGEILSALAGGHGVRCAYPDAKQWLIDRELPLIAGWRDKYGAEIQVVPDRFAAWQGATIKVMYVAESQHIPAVVDLLEQRFTGRIHLSVSQSDRIEIMPAGVTKAWGLERLAAELGFAREDVWAAGDANNDLEMISWAGHGCAMGHAPPAVRAAARHHLPTIDEEGLSVLPGLIRDHGPRRDPRSR